MPASRKKARKGPTRLNGRKRTKQAAPKRRNIAVAKRAKVNGSKRTKASLPRRKSGAIEAVALKTGARRKMALAADFDSYRPSEDEPFMNARQREYFRSKLEAWREEILRESRETLENLQVENQNHPDMADRASSESDRALELRTRDRQRKLISKIDAALKRLDDGTYGYCEETGEPISLKRLEARPIATLSVEAQERHERRERIYRDD